MDGGRATVRQRDGHSSTARVSYGLKTKGEERKSGRMVRKGSEGFRGNKKLWKYHKFFLEQRHS